MASEEWDDHDRSKKRLAHSTAYNALMSCDSNAILFTFGDNDTYPLWYMQEIEGVRTDVRIINLSLLGIDWYIDQLNNKINNADAIPMIWKKKDYAGDNHNYIQYNENSRIDQNKFYDLYDICKFLVADEAKLMTQGGEMMNYLPTKNFSIKSLTKAQLVAAGMAKPSDTLFMDTEVKFTTPKDMLIKDDIAVLNIIAGIASEGWKRPIYFGGGLPGDNYAGLDNYLRLEGVVYRLMPYRLTDSVTRSVAAIPGTKGTVDLDKTYDLFMNKYQWGNAHRNDVYFDEKNRLMFAAYRVNVSRVANQLSAAGRQADAVRILDRIDSVLSQTSYPYNPYNLEMFDASAYFMSTAYYNAGAKEKGAKVASQFVENLEKDISWILSLPDASKEELTKDAQQDISLINEFGRLAQSRGDSAFARKMNGKTEALIQKMSKELNMESMMGGQR